MSTFLDPWRAYVSIIPAAVTNTHSLNVSVPDEVAEWLAHLAELVRDDSDVGDISAETTNRHTATLRDALDSIRQTLTDSRSLLERSNATRERINALGESIHALSEYVDTLGHPSQEPHDVTRELGERVDHTDSSARGDAGIVLTVTVEVRGAGPRDSRPCACGGAS